ncbi:5-formyltetrahydrofolate cyclo-ligase [Leucothrix arctica]|uniref:5-formyltetrahydrofolate cyclo-ligase n=1 Tax=Leucothrix arctica TaxID=1481894 RepID=A0A317CA60_9GAMM|nr:5-formyltetrahydrofolate cyclo-ligase [Leucothrix arctica]PWQ92952.1 5-formyltetrahydrofolate cyclo-ligase [Leucothrix arctica]
MENQSTIRKHIQALRQALTKEQQVAYSKEICERVIDSGILNKAEHVAIYLPVRGEANPTPLLDFNLYSNKQFYLPVLSSTQQNHLEFAKFDANTPMKLNQFKIPEPDVNESDLLKDPTILDCVIMPLVGLDPMGNRIGMGGGFYDRTFSFKKTSQMKPLLIGFCYNFQIIAPQTPQQWDVPVDAIATQTSFTQL